MLTNLDGTFRLIYNFEIDFNKDELLHHKKQKVLDPRPVLNLSRVKYVLYVFQKVGYCII